jgi:hypothetical protein
LLIIIIKFKYINVFKFKFYVEIYYMSLVKNIKEGRKLTSTKPSVHISTPSTHLPRPAPPSKPQPTASKLEKKAFENINVSTKSFSQTTSTHKRTDIVNPLQYIGALKTEFHKLQDNTEDNIKSGLEIYKTIKNLPERLNLKLDANTENKINDKINDTYNKLIDKNNKPVWSDILENTDNILDAIITAQRTKERNLRESSKKEKKSKEIKKEKKQIFKESEERTKKEREELDAERNINVQFFPTLGTSSEEYEPTKTLKERKQKRTDMYTAPQFIPSKSELEEEIKKRRAKEKESKKEKKLTNISGSRPLLTHQIQEKAAEDLISESPISISSISLISPTHFKSQEEAAESSISSEPIQQLGVITTQTPTTQEDIAESLISSETITPPGQITIQSPTLSEQDAESSITPYTQLALIEKKPQILPFSGEPVQSPLEQQILDKAIAEQQAKTKQIVPVTKSIPKPPSKPMKSLPAPTSKFRTRTLDTINILTQQIDHSFSTITGDMVNQEKAMSNIIQNIIKLNDELDIYHLKNNRIEKKLEIVEINTMTKEQLEKHFVILKRLVNKLNRLVKFKMLLPKLISNFENKINRKLKTNPHINAFDEQLKIIETNIEMIKDKLSQPINSESIIEYDDIYKLWLATNKHYKLLKNYLKQVSQNKPAHILNKELHNIITSGKIYQIFDVNKDTMMMEYDEITNLVNELLAKLTQSKTQVTKFLASGNPDQTQAVKYYQEMLEVKNLLENLVDSLAYNKYTDADIDFPVDETYFEYDGDDNENMNRELDPVIKIINETALTVVPQNQLDIIKNYIMGINSESEEKWIIFTIIYQKFDNIIYDAIRILLKHFLLIKMMGLYDYKKEFEKHGPQLENPSDIFYKTAEKTMDEMGEPYVDDIIRRTLTNKDIQKTLESLRKTDVEITNLFKSYRNVNGINELFKNLLQMQFNTFIIKIRPYCWGVAWGAFIDKFVWVFNEKLGKM